MRQEKLTAYEQLAVKMFDDYARKGCSGVLYSCRLVADSGHIAPAEMKCMAWICMN